MKKNIYIVLLCLTSIAFSQENFKTEINAQLSFGRLGEDCKGRGICSFKLNAVKEQSNAIVYYDEDKILTLVIERAKIIADDEYKIVGNQLSSNSKAKTATFIMKDDLELELVTKTQLGISEIPKGNYPVNITKNAFTITFKLE